MPVDLIFNSNHTLHVDEVFQVTLTYTLQNVRCVSRSNIRITPDPNDPILDLQYTLIKDGTTNKLVLVLPFERQGTMTIRGTGTVFRSDTNTYDTINSGTAELTYDTRTPRFNYKDLPTIYEEMEHCDFIVGFNQNVTIDVPDPSDATQMFIFDGAFLGADPMLYRYTGNRTPQLPLPDDLNAATDWELMADDDFAQFFAIRFDDVPDGAQGVLNINVNETLFVSSDANTTLLVTAPQQQAKSRSVRQAQRPVIQAISTQFLTLGEVYEVQIPIRRGTATSVSVRGLALGSYYDFDETQQMIYIRGTAESLLTDATWECNASGPGGNAETVNQTYNYVQLAPIVSSLARQTIFLGSEVDILIPISNVPNNGIVITELIGLHHELVDDDGDENADHMRIYGTPPINANYAITQGSFTVIAINTGGVHTAITPFIFTPSAHCVDTDSDAVYVFDASTADGQTATTIRRYNLPSGLRSPRGITIDASNNAHCVDASADAVAVFDATTANGQTATIIRRYDLPSGLSAPEGISIDSEGNAHCVDNVGDEVFVFDASTADGQTATAISRYDLPTGLTSPKGISVDRSGNAHCVDASGDEVFVFDASTADGQTATTIRRYDLPTGLTDPQGISIDAEGNAHCINNSGDEVYVFDASTANGQTATTIRRYNLPSGLTFPTGISVI